MINLIPLACLAAILIFTGLKLAKPSLFAAVAKQGFERFAPFIVTIAGVLLTDLLIGIVLGIACSVAARDAREPAAARSRSRSTTITYLLSFRKDVSFLGKVALKHHLQQIPDGATVIVDATRADFVDPDVRELIDTFVAAAPRARHPRRSAATGTRGARAAVDARAAAVFRALGGEIRLPQ